MGSENVYKRQVPENAVANGEYHVLIAANKPRKGTLVTIAYGSYDVLFLQLVGVGWDASVDFAVTKLKIDNRWRIIEHTGGSQPGWT